MCHPRIEIGAVRRGHDEHSSRRFDHFTDAGAAVNRHVVHDDHRVRLSALKVPQHRAQFALHPSLKHRCVHRAALVCRRAPGACRSKRLGDVRDEAVDVLRVRAREAGSAQQHGVRARARGRGAAAAAQHRLRHRAPGTPDHQRDEGRLRARPVRRVGRRGPVGHRTKQGQARSSSRQVCIKRSWRPSCVLVHVCMGSTSSLSGAVSWPRFYDQEALCEYI